ncbi:MAG TPA: thioredoxin-like domain-containing protein [Acidobacteriaceae bacterium]
MPSAMKVDRRHFLGAAAMTVAAVQLSVFANAIAETPSSRLPVEGDMPSFKGATQWINSPPLTPTGLRGKVVLVGFWTYTCVNWRRTLPYLRAWAEKYKDHGLVLVGVHTPEFSFEKDLNNIHWALKDMKIDYPVAVDSDRAIWNAFDNEYWPALYFVDGRGRIRHHQFGEGQYQQSETILQQLLTEAGSGGIGHDLVSVQTFGAEAGASWSNLKSPESYLGYQQAVNFASPGGTARNKPHVYEAPAHLALNHWALTGDWTAGKEAVSLNRPSGRIQFRFHARDVNLILGPATRGSTAKFRVLVDGQSPDSSHGVDTDSQGNGTVIEQRFYQLIRQQGPIVDRFFEVEFLDAGVEAFDFTFG